MFWKIGFDNHVNLSDHPDILACQFAIIVLLILLEIFNNIKHASYWACMCNNDNAVQEPFPIFLIKKKNSLDLKQII